MTLTADVHLVSPELRPTDDRSATLYRADVDECYHSVFGALTESEHIFIRNGLLQCPKEKIRILEVGLGTGLNLALTAKHANGKEIVYHAVELYPISGSVIDSYAKYFDPEIGALMLKACSAPWDAEVDITSRFTIRKILGDVREASLFAPYDLVYYDAFSPEKQPEMWSAELFAKIVAAMGDGALLTTYCSKGVVKQALRQNNLDVKRLAGPPHKRHILVARKLVS